MSSEPNGRIMLPSLLRLVALVNCGKESEPVWQTRLCRVDPRSILSYIEYTVMIDGDVKTLTKLYGGGTSYLIEMPILEFDKMLDSENAGYDIVFPVPGENKQ